MTRLPIKNTVLHALFAKSGNQCAFPGCQHPLIEETTIFVAQVCHIEAAEPGGPRFNPCQSDEERRGYGNLLLLCYRHHRITDDVSKYPVESLREIKLAHEEKHFHPPFEAPKAVIAALSREMEAYWASVALVHATQHVIDDLKVPIETTRRHGELAAEISELLSSLDTITARLAGDPLSEDALRFLRWLGYDTARIEEAPYYENPFVSRNWDLVNLGLGNVSTRIGVILQQMQIVYLVEYLKSHPADESARRELDELKKVFHEVARTAGLAD